MDREALFEFAICAAIFLPIVYGVLGGRHSWFWQLFAWMVGIEVAP